MQVHNIMYILVNKFSAVIESSYNVLIGIKKVNYFIFSWREVQSMIKYHGDILLQYNIIAKVVIADFTLCLVQWNLEYIIIVGSGRSLDQGPATAPESQARPEQSKDIIIIIAGQ